MKIQVSLGYAPGEDINTMTKIRQEITEKTPENFYAIGKFIKCRNRIFLINAINYDVESETTNIDLRQIKNSKIITPNGLKPS